MSVLHRNGPILLASDDLSDMTNQGCFTALILCWRRCVWVSESGFCWSSGRPVEESSPFTLPVPFVVSRKAYGEDSEPMCGDDWLLIDYVSKARWSANHFPVSSTLYYGCGSHGCCTKSEDVAHSTSKRLGRGVAAGFETIIYDQESL